MNGGLKRSAEWKIYFTVIIKFVSTVGAVKYRQIYFKSDNSEIMIGQMKSLKKFFFMIEVSSRSRTINEG